MYKPFTRKESSPIVERDRYDKTQREIDKCKRIIMDRARQGKSTACCDMADYLLYRERTIEQIYQAFEEFDIMRISDNRCFSWR